MAVLCTFQVKQFGGEANEVSELFLAPFKNVASQSLVQLKRLGANSKASTFTCQSISNR